MTPYTDASVAPSYRWALTAAVAIVLVATQLWVRLG